MVPGSNTIEREPASGRTGRRARTTSLWVVLSVVVVVIPITVAIIFGSSYPADVSERDLLGVWRADTGNHVVLNADGTAELDLVTAGSGPSAEWTWDLDRHSIRLIPQGSVELAADVEISVVTCGFDVCLRYGMDEGETTLRHHAGGY